MPSLTASFHLTRYPVRLVPVELVRFVTQRRTLAATPGLRFSRLLGTGRGSSMTLSADLRRWALFAVWDDDEALTRFLAHSPVAHHWQRHGQETWSVGLEPLAAHGAWGGNNPLGHRHAPTGDVAPLAVLTRARIRPSKLAAFYRAVPAADRRLAAAPGRIASIGVGEAPVGRQATFSLGASADAVSDFAYRAFTDGASADSTDGDDDHRRIVARTRAEGWYAEELFARFRPYRSEGTWAGTDPLSPGCDNTASGGAGDPPKGGGDEMSPGFDTGTTGHRMP
ncbi:hypothetical protein BH24ACT3_BH24ACT3_13760 [soil metagenome]